MTTQNIARIIVFFLFLFSFCDSFSQTDWKSKSIEEKVTIHTNNLDELVSLSSSQKKEFYQMRRAFFLEKEAIEKNPQNKIRVYSLIKNFHLKMEALLTKEQMVIYNAKREHINKRKSQ